MNATVDGTNVTTEYDLAEYVEGGPLPLYDAIYIVATLLIGTLSAIVTSFLRLGRRRRRQLRHADADVPSVHRTGGWSDGERQVDVRV